MTIDATLNADGQQLRTAAPPPVPGVHTPPAPTPMLATPGADKSAAGSSRSRKLGFIVLALLVFLAAGAYLIMVLAAPPKEATDDAYVGGNVVVVTARDGGTALALHADNTQHVQRGEPLVDLDPATTRVQLASAEAQLGSAVRAVRSSKSEVDEAGAEIAKAQADLTKAQDDFTRRKAAAADGAVSGEEVSHATDALSTSKAALLLAQARRERALSAVEGASISTNPQVLNAIANLRQAAINQSHTTIVAPVSGVVAQRTVQLGQRVAAGTPLMAVVPLDSLWIDANFRETQLQHLRVGQPCTITADVYGGKMVFHGHVLGLGAGSGSAFALLPAQNATGNWIKIVQRVPVRISLDPNELAKKPLRVGLSVAVEVETADQSGAFVSDSAAPAGGVQESLDGGPEVETRIAKIIADNSGSAK
jgi:membrane fusion protein (multidrug efflux system)